MIVCLENETKKLLYLNKTLAYYIIYWMKTVMVTQKFNYFSKFKKKWQIIWKTQHVCFGYLQHLSVRETEFLPHLLFNILSESFYQ